MMRGGVVDPMRLCNFADWVLYCSKNRRECEKCAIRQGLIRSRVRATLSYILRDIERIY